MQAIKEKLNDMSAMRKAKAEAKEEEKAEKELAKARVEVAREVRMAREAEASMDLHVSKAVEKAAQHEQKHPQQMSTASRGQEYNSPGGNIPTNPDAAAGGDPYAYGGDAARSGGLTTHNSL